MTTMAAAPPRTRDRTGTLIVGTVIVGVAYSVLSTASRAMCPGGVTGDGGFIDANGQATDVAPTCLSLTLKPNGLVYLALFVIVLIGIVVADRSTPERATRVLGIALVAAVAVAVVATVGGLGWLFSFPMDSWRGEHGIWVPPFLDVQVVTTVMGN